MPAIRNHFGTRWLVQRGLYSLKLRTGSLRRQLPSGRWDDPSQVSELFSDRRLADPQALLDYRKTQAPQFFFSAVQRESYAPFLRKWDDKGNNPVLLADEISRGIFRFFGNHSFNLGFPPDWHLNAATGLRLPAGRHWSQIGDFSHGDIKSVWEPSRFGFAYTLVRSYWRTVDERYPELFWQLVESWRQENQPQQGANWKCGQEATFRAMAWCFALHGFLLSATSTPSRVAQLVEMMAVTANRIESNIAYALNQANNHGISEGVGLWTIGVLFPELSGAERWRDRGRSVLESEARKLIYEDGSFAQHSVNYHRLMLHDYIWAMRLADLQGAPLTNELKARVERSVGFLFQIQDETTGAVPNYGHNDGALILPLNNCPYHDFRPVIGAGWFLTRGTKTFGDGTWDEDLLWLFGPDSLGQKVEAPEADDLKADIGGYYTLRSPDSFAFTRCAQFKHRPGQADMLHVDLWWRGENIALDAGTYSYNPRDPWGASFEGTAIHNTVTVDQQDQMERAGRFLWLPWLSSRVRGFRRAGALAYLEGEHDGYHRLPDPVTHRRGILALGNESWLVLDSLSSSKEHDYRLHWLLADLPYEFDDVLRLLSFSTQQGNFFLQWGVISGTAECSLVRADEKSSRGWQAPSYGERTPALSLAVTQRSHATIFWSLFAPVPHVIDADEKSIQIKGGSFSGEIKLASQQFKTLLRSVCGPDGVLELSP